MAADTAAKDLINMAKNRMNRFYNPALYVEAPKRQLSAEDSIFVGMGGTAPPTPAPGGISGTGVMAMMDLLIADLDKTMQELETEEKDAQAEYEELMQDSAAKRMADVASIAQKDGAKAHTEAALNQAKSERMSKTKEA